MDIVCQNLDYWMLFGQKQLVALRTDQVTFHPGSYADPAGRLFLWEGNLYRGINSSHADFFLDLFSRGIIQDLVDRNLIVDTELTELELEGYSLVLRHATVPFVSYCFEWCGDMLKAAALFVLHFERKLRTYRLTLKDAHPWNVLFIGPAPIWVDIGSLSPAGDNKLSWSAKEGFDSYFTRPLKIIAAGHSHMAHLLLRDGYIGIRSFESDAITGVEAIRSAKQIAKKIIPPRLRPAFRSAVTSVRATMASSKRASASKYLREGLREIECIRLPQRLAARSVRNSAEFPAFTTTADWTAKHRSLSEIISSTKPESVLDVGSHQGWYSQLAAREGASVVSVDVDEPSVTKQFRAATAQRLPILPVLMDVRETMPGMQPSTIPIAAADRFRCDMVLALGLVHDLVFKQAMNFELVVYALTAFVKKWLVVEFIGAEDPEVCEWRREKFDWYDLEHFTHVLKSKYRRVTQFRSDNEHRSVVFCEK